MTLLLISAVICIGLIVATSILITTKEPKKQKGELMRLSETKATSALGVLIIAMGFFILWMKYTNPAIAGSDQTSYLFVSGFAVLCMAVGCGMMLYTFLKKVVVLEDGIVFVNLLGGNKRMAWREITELKVPPLTNKLTLIGHHTHFTVGGEAKAYKAFLKIAKEHIKPEVSSDTLGNLLNRSLF